MELLHQHSVGKGATFAVVDLTKSGTTGKYL